MKRQRFLVGVLALGLLLALAVGLSMRLSAHAKAQALGPEPPQGEVHLQAGVGVAAAVDNAIAIQGRLTRDDTPVNGVYELTFRIYDVAGGGTALCSDNPTATIRDGLFNAEMDTCTSNNIDGRQLWLGLQIGTDSEMTPRQPIYPVPYAFSLRPGAAIKGELDDPILYVYNTGSGAGLWGTSLASTGIHGSSWNGTGVYGSSLSGVGVHADSLSGAAIAADGTGIITSTASSYLWISGNGLRPFHQNDSTIIDMDTIGGAKIYRGASAGNKNVMLPITIQGPLYGQDVTVSHLTIYWVGDTTFDAISAVLLRRQTGVCSSSDCYVNILYDSTDHGCEDDVYPTGCPLQYDLTSNNELTAGSGILYLTLELAFESSTSWIEIGGVRLTLEHD